MHSGSNSHSIDTAEGIEKAAREYREFGAVCYLAATTHCELECENDQPIIFELMDRYGWETMLQYLAGRQLTNFYYMDVRTRPLLEDYVRENVVERYNKTLGLGHVFSLDQVMDYIADEQGISDAVSKKHFEEQTVMDGILDFIEIKGVGNLSKVQELAIDFNQRRDKALARWLLKVPPDKGAFMLIGGSHLHTLAAELHRLRRMSDYQYKQYIYMMHRLGSPAVAWVKGWKRKGVPPLMQVKIGDVSLEKPWLAELVINI